MELNEEKDEGVVDAEKQLTDLYIKYNPEGVGNWVGNNIFTDFLPQNKSKNDLFQ